MADRHYSLHISPNCSSILDAGNLLREVIIRIKMVVVSLIILIKMTVICLLLLLIV